MARDLCTVKVGKKTAINLTPNQCAVLQPTGFVNTDEADSCGSHACAYGTREPGWIVKFTDDAQDVRGFMAAGDSGLTPKVRGIFRLRGQRKGRKPVYAMQIERAEPLTKKEEIFINEVLALRLGLNAFDLAERSDPRTGVARPFEIDPQTRTDVRDVCWRIANAAKARAKPGFDDPTASFRECVPLINRSLDVTESLGRRGVFLTDNHSGNWGKQNGKLVAIDLGLSRPKWDTKRRMPTILDGFRWPKKPR